MSNSETSILVEGLSKCYLLPHRQRSGLKAHLVEFLPSLARRDESDYFWALRDVDFEVRRGEVLGIIGRNGSGKSTLLKILSGVTQPTQGRATLRGKVGSLLEVGTGFHPDLSGRENVYMAGALLGLRHSEIKAHFDEIVDFSGIEEFIDVPVKRYSSGMYVRLAYAVASMLRSDILILDEVMAVGDAEFKEKSQRNIERIARDGRTVLFVSHSMDSVLQFCNRGMMLKGGRVVALGSAEDVVAHYLRDINHIPEESDGTPAVTRRDLVDNEGWTQAPSLEGVVRTPWMTSASIHRSDGVEACSFRIGDGIRIRIRCQVPFPSEMAFNVYLFNGFGQRVVTLSSRHMHSEPFQAADKIEVECAFDHIRMTAGDYFIGLEAGRRTEDGWDWVDAVPDVFRIRVEVGDYFTGASYPSQYQGPIAQQSFWGVV